MHVQSVQNYCFSLSNMQVCGVFVAAVVVVAFKLPIVGARLARFGDYTVNLGLPRSNPAGGFFERD